MGVSNRWFPEISPDEAENLFLQMGEYVLRFESEEFGEEYEERARLELRETPEVKQEAIAKLRELLKGEPPGFEPRSMFCLQATHQCIIDAAAGR